MIYISGARIIRLQGYRLEDLKFKSWQGLEVFFFSKTSD
jgi:hypothetical protein